MSTTPPDSTPAPQKGLPPDCTHAPGAINPDPLLKDPATGKTFRPSDSPAPRPESLPEEVLAATRVLFPELCTGLSDDTSIFVHKATTLAKLWPAPAPSHGEPSALAVKAAEGILLMLGVRPGKTNCDAVASIIHRTFSPVAGKPQAGATELIDLLVDISLTIQDRCEGHTVAYSSRFLPFLPRIETALTALKSDAAMQREDKEPREDV